MEIFTTEGLIALLQVIGIDLKAWAKELELHHELFQQLEHCLRLQRQAINQGFALV